MQHQTRSGTRCHRGLLIRRIRRIRPIPPKCPPPSPLRAAAFLALLLLALAAGPAPAAPDEALLLHLPLDGSLEPAAGGALGAPVAQGKPQFVAGRHGQAVQLSDGACLRVKMPDAVRKGEFAIAFWVKPLWHPNDNVPHPIFEIPADPKTRDKVGWAPNQILFSKGWSETIAPNHLYGAVDPDAAKLHLKPGQWTHVLLNYSVAGQFEASYFDGEGSRAPRKELKPLDPPDDILWLGARAGGKVSGDIVVDDFRVYGRPLEPAEIPAAAGASFPPPRDYGLLGTECDPSKAVETPHVKWAKPLAGGRLRVLGLTEGKRAREFIELAQRLDVDLSLVTTPAMDTHTLKNPESFQAAGAKVADALRAGRVDCTVVAGFGWNLLPAETREAILAHVRAGGGLLLVNPTCVGGPGASRQFGHGVVVGWEDTPDGRAIEALVGRLPRDDEEYLSAGIPWGELSAFRAPLGSRTPERFFRGGQVEKGRVLLYDIPLGGIASREGLTPSIAYQVPFDLFDYDYAVGAAARAVLWAAGREGKVRLAGVAYRAPRLLEANVATGTAGQWTVEVVNAGPAAVSARLLLAARTRGFDAPFEAARDVTLKPGLNRVEIPHTLAAIGTVFGDVRLLLDGKAADWATGVVQVKPGNPRFLQVTADRESYAPGEQPRIAAGFVYKQYAVKAGEKAQIRWRLYDAFGRLAARATRDVTLNFHDELPAEDAWSLDRLDPASLCYELVVALVRNERTTDRRVLTLRCRRPFPDDFLLTSWAGGESPSVGLADILLRDRYGLDCLGTTVIGDVIGERYRNQLEWVNRRNLQPWVYATHLGGGTNAQGVRTPDMADPVYLAGLRRRMEEMARVTEPFSPLYYSLGDEVQLGPPHAQASDEEQKAFAAGLRRRYPSLETLNAEWGTQVKDWKELAIPPSDDLLKGKAAPPLSAAVKDWREGLFAGMIATGVEGACQVAPAARVGIEGIFGHTHAYGGYDYWKMTRQSTFMGMYAAGMEMNMVRSFQKPGDLLGCWWNYALLDREYCRFAPWHLMLKGAHTLMWFTDYCGDRYTALNPDYTPFTHFEWMMEEMRPIQAGIGKMVMRLPREPARVAVLYEQRNLNRTSPQFLSVIVFATMLDDLGIAHDFVSGEQVAAGELAKRGYRALLLPGQFHMSEAVAGAIRRYVTAGGHVVADVLPADANGYRRYPKRLLDDLFADPTAMKGAAAPQSAGDLAAWPTHQRAAGKGRSLLFGFYANTYPYDRMKARGEWLRRPLGEFLAAAGAAPSVRVAAADKTFQPVTVVCYRDGDALYAALQRDYMVADPSPRDFTVAAGAPAHLYDVRAGRYLGRTDRATLNLEVARGAMLAFLPYRAVEVQTDGLRQMYHQGEVVQFRAGLQVEGGKPGRGVYRVEVLNPAGERVLPLCRKVRSQGGVAEVALPLAFNDPAGKWTLRVADVATGLSVERPLEVAPAGP